MSKESDAIAALLASVLGLLWLIVFAVLNIGLFWLAWKHRHESEGIVFALLYIAEQIHLKPRNPFLGEYGK